MQDFTYSCTLDELNLMLVQETLVGGVPTCLLLRDQTTGDLEVWVPHAEGLLTWRGHRYGYSHDVLPAPHSLN